jgi:hypothetical protein
MRFRNGHGDVGDPSMPNWPWQKGHLEALKGLVGGKFLECRLTPWQAVLSIHLMLTMDGTTVEYKPLMDWLRVAAD